MNLADFVDTFGGLSDESFARRFPNPFLLQEGGPLDDEPLQERVVLYLTRSSHDEELVVGRAGARAQLVIQEPTVSKAHARFLPPKSPDGSWSLEDLDSTNGTFVEGTRLVPNQPQTLADECVVGLGRSSSMLFLESDTFLELMRQGATKAGVCPVDSLSDTPLDAPRSNLETRELTPPVAEELDSSATVQLSCPPLDPLTLRIGMCAVVGRSSRSASFVLIDHGVSRRHAEIERRADGVYLRDLGSVNGVYLGELKVKVGDTPIRVPLNEPIWIQDFVLRIRLAPGAEETTIRPPREYKLVSGSLAQISLKPLLMGLQDQHKTGVLEIFAPGFSGAVSFRAGNPCGATTEDGAEGAEAVRRMLALEEGNFLIDPAPDRVPPRGMTETFREIIKSREGENNQ